MKTKQLLFAFVAILALPALAQTQKPGNVVVDVTELTITEVDCKPIYTANKCDNWFIQLGAGGNMPLV